MRGVLGVVLLTILALYLFSHIIVKLPILHIKEYSVIGIREGEKPLLKEYLKSLGRSIIFLPEEKIYQDLNKKYGNKFKYIKVDREFTQSGIRIHFHFARRIPVARLKFGENTYLLDKDGILFIDKYEEGLPLITVKNKEEFEKLRTKIVSLASYGDKIEILENKVILSKGKIKYVLPDIRNLNERDLKVLNYALRKQFNVKVIDLRYKKFILLR